MIDACNVDESILKLAWESWGEAKQLDQLVEECAELIVAIKHYQRNRVGKEKIAEEIADVFICSTEIAKQFIGEPIVDQCVKDKMVRLTQIVFNHLTKKLKEAHEQL